MSSISSGIAGINQAQDLLSVSASNIARAPLNGSADTARDIVNSSQAKAEGAASVKVINASEKMREALLDVFA
jgi:hypothetical protein